MGSVACSRRPGGTPDDPAPGRRAPARPGEAPDALVARWRLAPVPTPGGARTEALALAAAVAESRRGPPADWAARPSAAPARQDFFDAASRGRRWRDAAHGDLSSLAAQGSPHAPAYAAALAEVASAACELGEPTIGVIGNASVAAAAQLAAVRPARRRRATREVPVSGRRDRPGRTPVAAPGRRAAAAGGTDQRRRGRSRSCSPSSTR